MVATPELDLTQSTSATHLEAAVNGSTAVESAPSLDEHQKQLLAEMADDLNKWGIGLIIMGIISVVLSAFLDPLWGVVIVVVGLLARIIHHRAMYVVIGAGLVLIGLSNLLADSFGGWTIFGLMQLAWGYQELRKYGRFAAVDQPSLWRTLCDENHGVLGIISATASVGAVFLFYTVVTLFSALEILSPGTFGPEADNIVVDLFVFGIIVGSMLLHLLGLLLGMGGLFQFKRRKVFAVVGLLGNIALLVAYGVIMMSA